MAKQVTEVHQEVMHYTTGAGLAGIVSSDALWATHAAALNDSQEITHFLDTRLIDIIREETAGAFSDLAKDPAIANRFEENGGFDAVVKKEADNISRILRNLMITFHEPHILSFSAITNDRVRSSGLLSQWRGYGTDGGYAIIFDSSKIDDLLLEESSQYPYQHISWGDVYYYGFLDSKQRESEEIVEAETLLRASIRELHSSQANSIEQAYDAMITLCCLYKHWGFHEEQEVRVIVIPPNEDVLQLAKQSSETTQSRRISVFSRGGMLVPYLALFGSSSAPTKRLPIKRVIVGPHPLSSSRRKTVEVLLKSNGYDADVCISEIPYLGR